MFRAFTIFLALAFLSLRFSTAQELHCEDWRSFNDADFRLHAQTLENLNPCLSFEPFEASGQNWRLVRIQRGPTIPQDAPLVVVLHDNEDAAFLGALCLLARFDVQLVVLDADEERNWQGLDPNRLFVAQGSIVDACAHAAVLDSRFAASVLRDWSGRHPVISLHSNAPGHKDDGDGGKGSISLFHPTPGQIAFFGAPIPDQPRLRNPDNLIYLTGPGQNPSPRQAQLIQAMRDQGLNVFYSPIDPTQQDCSLSDFLTLKGLSDLYFNVEVREGDFETALALSGRLHRVLEQEGLLR